jgi:hypothetical protein
MNSRPNTKAKAILRPADAEPRPRLVTKAKSPAAGAHQSTKRRSIAATTANPTQTDAEPRPNPTAKSIGKAVGAHQFTRNVGPDPLRKPGDDQADADGEEDRRFDAPLVVTIRELWRRRQSWHRAEKSLTLAASAICRRYVGVQGKADKPGLAKAKALLEQIEAGTDTSEASIAVLPILMARQQIEPHRLSVEKVLENLAKDLPVADVVEETKGLGYLGLAGIVGEAGAVGEYRTVQGLWKRFGLAVIDGKKQGKRTDAIEALEHGYSPPRRSVMWNVGCGLIGGMGNGVRPVIGESMEDRPDLSQWQKLFVQRLRFEAERDPSHRKDDVERKGDTYESYSKHAANRARRYVEKQFLRHLWCLWKRGGPVMCRSPAGERLPRTNSSAETLV